MPSRKILSEDILKIDHIIRISVQCRFLFEADNML